jgi:hypothetical protein
VGYEDYGEHGRKFDSCYGKPDLLLKYERTLKVQVNVVLPDIPPPKNVDDMFKQLVYMEHRMFELKARFVPVSHVHICQEVSR